MKIIIQPEYYICSFDALSHLYSKEIIYVYHLRSRSFIAECITCVDAADAIDTNYRHNVSILVKKLTAEEITLLTLSCKNIKLYSRDYFTCRLTDRIIENIWTIV